MGVEGHPPTAPPQSLMEQLRSELEAKEAGEAALKGEVARLTEEGGRLSEELREALEARKGLEAKLLERSEVADAHAVCARVVRLLPPRWA